MTNELATVGEKDEQETGQDSQGQASSGQQNRLTFRRVKPNDEGLGRPHHLDNPRVMAMLEASYRVGCTHDEAAMTAQIAPDTVQNWLSQQVKMEIYVNDKPTGQFLTYAQMCNLWKCHMLVQAKRKIYRSVVDEKTGTHDAWRVVERRQPQEWGLKAGVGSVDGSGGGAPPLDLASEGAKRAQEFQVDPNLEDGLEDVPAT